METDTALMKSQKELLETLAAIGGKLTAEEDIEFKGKKIVLPETMKLSEAIRFLREKEAEDETEMVFQRTFRYRPWDGALCTLKALKRAFGMVHQKGVPGFFGEKPPQLITINTGPNETEQVPWGGMAVPLMPGAIMYLGSSEDEEFGNLFVVNVKAPRKYRFEIQGIFELIEEELKTNSLYRGKAFDGQEMPQFLDLRGVDESKVIYSQEVVEQLEANVWSLLKYTDKMREVGVPMKRAVLFEGPYGTGKTLGAYLTAKVAQENGWTFVYCRPTRDDLNHVIATARLYQPAVVFFEDVDSIASGEDGDRDQVSALLDVFDGIQSKGTEIVCVLTTNHVERIHKGMVRPGRLDAVIHIGELDSVGVRRMTQAVIPKELLGRMIDWEEVGISMKGFLPAFVREALDRSVRYSIARNKGVPALIETRDLVLAADGLRPQLELMEGAKEIAKADALSKALGDVVASRIHDTEVIDSYDEVQYQLKRS